MFTFLGWFWFCNLFFCFLSGKFHFYMVLPKFFLLCIAFFQLFVHGNHILAFLKCLVESFTQQQITLNLGTLEELFHLRGTSLSLYYTCTGTSTHWCRCGWFLCCRCRDVWVVCCRCGWFLCCRCRDVWVVCCRCGWFLCCRCRDVWVVWFTFPGIQRHEFNELWFWSKHSYCFSLV